MKLRLFVAVALAVMLLPAAVEAWETALIAGKTTEAGVVTIYEEADAVIILIEPFVDDGWMLRKVHVYFGEDPVPLTNSGNPKIGKFSDTEGFGQLASYWPMVVPGQCPVASGGAPVRNVSVHADLALLDDAGTIVKQVGAWALGDYAFEGPRWGWWSQYTLTCTD